MGVLTAFPTPDYENSVSISGAQGTLLTGTSSGVIAVGQHRLIHISATVVPVNTSRNCISYTFGNSAATGTTPAPTPTASSPFLLGDEGYVVDTGFYDQNNLANIAAYNGAVSLAYSISLLSKH